LIANEVDELVSVSSNDISSIKPSDGDAFMVAKVDSEMLKVIKTEDFIS
jgi:hypothetical protein